MTMPHMCNPSLNRPNKKKKVNSTKTKQSVMGKKYKVSGSVSLNNNNDSRHSNGEYQELSSSSSEEEYE